METVPSRVWMNKKTGQLLEQFYGCLGGVIAWEDISESNRPVDDKSPLQFDDEYNKDDYEDLGEL